VKDDRTIRIGDVARSAGVTVETVRFYEHQGLLSAAQRSGAGNRRYGPDTIVRVRFIKQAQAVGLTLKDIGVLVKYRHNASRTACRTIRAVLAQRLAELDGRIQEMQAFRTVLREHLDSCDHSLAAAVADDCPTIEALERGLDTAGSRRA
jgi:DNA-binding transcriptional MerR regulator